MTDEQPAQPLTDAELAQIREDYEGVDPYDSVPRLLAEVDRLRAENTAVKTKCDGFQKMMNSAVSAGVTIDGERLDALREVEQLRAEATGTALGHLAKIERLQSQRDALVRKLGLDWGPDEFGDLAAVPMEGSSDRGEMLSDLQWYISDMGLEHWQICPMGAEDCYLCAGHVAIRDRWEGVE